MTQISSIRVRVECDAPAGDDLFLGLCGRELHLDPRVRTLLPGGTCEYAVRSSATLRVEDVDVYPVYLRRSRDADDDWALVRATVVLNDEPTTLWDTSGWLGATGFLRLGTSAGETAYLLRREDLSPALA